jgi:abhydrolase domain-containing protein 12
VYKSFLVHKFDTLSVISVCKCLFLGCSITTPTCFQKVKVPLLILHAEDDWEIYHTHSDALFDTLLEPYLPQIWSPPLSPASWSPQQWNEHQAQLVSRRETRESLLTRTVIPNFGFMDEFMALGERIILLKTFTGSHNEVGTLEGVHEVIRVIFFTSKALR